MSGSLYIYPRNHRTTPPSVVSLTRILRQSGFIGDAIGDNTYLSGSEFLKYITFAGCSPQLTFTPPKDGTDDFCHVAVHGPYRKPRMITGPHTQRPRCPHCSHRISDWHVLEAAWRSSGTAARFTCPACTMVNAVDHWCWRRYALFGRLMVAVRSVFPNEGVPNDAFLNLLDNDTNVEWDYGWAATIAD